MLEIVLGGSAGLAAAALLAARLDLYPDILVVTGVLCSFLTPLNQLLVFCWLVFHKWAGLRGEVLSNFESLAVLLFCLIHFAYIAWLYRRAREKGASFHGFVDPGEGTVE